MSQTVPRTPASTVQPPRPLPDLRQRYLRLLDPAHHDRLVQLLREQGYWASLGCIEAALQSGPPFAWLQLRVAANPDYAGHAGGLFIDLSDWPEMGVDGLFYLPVVGLVNPADPVARAHELRHLEDLLDLLERDPDYPARAFRMVNYHEADPTDLEERIDFEVGRIFAFEPPAFRVEWSLGVTGVELPPLAGRAAWLECETEEEFVRTCTAEYIRLLDTAFQHHHSAQRVQAAIATAVRRHGRGLFGRRADKAVMRQLRRTAFRWAELIGLDRVLIRQTGSGGAVARVTIGPGKPLPHAIQR